MRISMRMACAAALVPLALAGTCLAAAWGASPALADGANVTDAGAAVAQAMGEAAGGSGAAQAGASVADAAGEDVFSEGVLRFAGLQMELPADMQVRVAGTLASAVNEDGTLTASVEDLSFAGLPDKADLAGAFKEAANKTVAGYSTASVEDKGTVELGEGVTGYVFQVEASGPYEAVKNADGTTTAAEVGPEGHWSITQVYVALKGGGFAMAQAAVSQAATDEDVAAAQAAVESLALEAADAGDEAAEQAGASEQAAADTRADAGGFTFELPEGLRAADGLAGVWLGTADNVLVEAAGTLVEAEDAATLDEAGVKALFEAAAKGMGGTFEGSTTRKAGDVELQVGVFSLADGGQTYECLLALVPCADGSVEGLTCVCDPAAAKAWADKLDALLGSVEVTPVQADGQAEAPAGSEA